MPKLNNRPMGEFSPYLVTQVSLITSQQKKPLPQFLSNIFLLLLERAFIVNFNEGILAAIDHTKSFMQKKLRNCLSWLTFVFHVEV
jgi:hypothetical protein